MYISHELMTCIIVYAVCVNKVLSLDILMKNKVPRKRIKRKKIKV